MALSMTTALQWSGSSFRACGNGDAMTVVRAMRSGSAATVVISPARIEADGSTANRRSAPSLRRSGNPVPTPEAMSTTAPPSIRPSSDPTTLSLSSCQDATRAAYHSEFAA